ncbi:MAG: PIN domain-containing protein [Chloroflexota bacterium]
MPVFALDSSCMIAALLPEHRHHGRALQAINSRLDARHTMIVVAHTLLETYSSLTRMPAPSRVAPSVALSGIEDTFFTKGVVVAMRHDEYVQLMYRLVNGGTLGGQVYDAAIVACARSAGADELLTFNERHFRPFEGNGLAITVP